MPDATLLVAVYGAGLSTAVALQQYLGRQPRLKVHLGLLDLPDDEILEVRAINIGSRKVVVARVTLEVPKPTRPEGARNPRYPPYGYTIFSAAPGAEVSIEPGDTFTWAIS